MTPPGMDRQHHLDHVARVRGDQIPVDFIAEQRVDMLVADRFVRAIEGGIAQTAHPWHQLDAKEPAKSEDRLTLTLGIGMKRIGLNLRTVFHQRIKNMNRLPDTAGDEAGEQGDIGVGDVVVSDTAISTVADVPGTNEIILAEFDVGAVGDRCSATAPMPRQRKANILVDDIDHRRLQLLGIDVLRVDPAQHLSRCDFRGVAGRLAWPEIAAIAEYREEITLYGISEFWIGARRWPKMAGVAGPVFSMLENI